MLLKLLIQNYAIIERLELFFSEELSVITGETGAGKSIVMEALSLVLGERADQSVLFDREKKCVVEGYFDASRLNLSGFFKQYDLDEDARLIFRREVSASGKSRAFINDTPVNLSVMKELGDQLVDMHSQHQSQELNSSLFPLLLLDSLSKQGDAVKNFTRLFQDYQAHLRRWKELDEQNIRENKELDYLNFQLKEFSSVSLKVDDQVLLEEEQKQLEHAEEIKQQFSSASQLLADREISIIKQLKDVSSLLNSIKKYSAQADQLLDRLDSCRIELDDIASELDERQMELQMDPVRLKEIQQRLDSIYRLEKKHHVNSVSDLLEIANNLRTKIESIHLQTEELKSLELKITSEKKHLIEVSQKISAARLKEVTRVEQTVNSMLKEVGMPHAQIKINHRMLSENQMTSLGLDHFQFLFASNKGSEFHEIRKIASGGELSRLMLCFKSLIAASTSLPTLIFDEIDSGISGETAMKVSRILKQLSSKHQVICITHLPQLAAKGNMHYFIYKELLEGRTYTRVKELNAQEKVKAIAQMISGEKVTAAALESAKELLN
ncbi:MAG: DNA repair protein RecN [Chitinophagales bacterium]|nr:DNA repair protein RecN [Chitinophagales bacterium]